MRNLKISFVLLVITITCGIIGYTLIEGMSPFEAFYMTVITISTVGFQEIKPLSPQGRILTLTIITFGISIGAYALSTSIRMFIEGELRKTYGRKKLDKKILQLKDHFIICGYGRIGSLICDELSEHNKEFVVIESDPERIMALENKSILYIPDDASTDETLIKAGILKAKGIVTAVGADADNVFITLTAKGLNPKIFILSRASDVKDEIKLKRAGASRVVSPYLIGGQRMAQVLIRPTVVDFIDIAIMEDSIGLQMDEIIIKHGSPLIGKNLIESNLRKNYGVIIVLIKKFSGEMIFNPQPREVIDINDVLVMLGKKEDMKRLDTKMI